MSAAHQTKAYCIHYPISLITETHIPTLESKSKTQMHRNWSLVGRAVPYPSSGRAAARRSLRNTAGVDCVCYVMGCRRTYVAYVNAFIHKCRLSMKVCLKTILRSRDPCVHTIILWDCGAVVLMTILYVCVYVCVFFVYKRMKLPRH